MAHEKLYHSFAATTIILLSYYLYAEGSGMVPLP